VAPLGGGGGGELCLSDYDLGPKNIPY